MRGKISTGIWFIFFGIVALLHNFNIVNFNFWALLPYWPLLIITLGANLIFQNKKNGVLILSVMNIALCIFLGYIGLTSHNKFDFTKNIQINYSDDLKGALPQISTPYESEIETAKLDLSIGALALNIDSIPSKELINAAAAPNVGLKLNRSGDKKNPKLEIETVLKEKKEKSNKVTLSLNENPIWDITVNMGASSFKGDLSKYKFSKIEMNAGAASLNLKLGEPSVAESRVEINTAASSFKIAIPEGAACRVEMSTLLSSNSLEGFEKQGEYFQTPNFENAQKKYYIEINGAANSLKINRY